MWNVAILSLLKGEEKKLTAPAEKRTPCCVTAAGLEGKKTVGLWWIEEKKDASVPRAGKRGEGESKAEEKTAAMATVSKRGASLGK